MQSSRRHLLLMSLAFMPAVLLHGQSQDSAPPPDPARGRRRPDTPDDASNGTNSPNFPAGASNKAILEEHQKNIKREVEKLYDLASQLKTEVEKTDSTTILSLAMVKKAEEIEKLARQIRDHAKG